MQIKEHLPDPTTPNKDANVTTTIFRTAALLKNHRPVIGNPQEQPVDVTQAEESHTYFLGEA